MALTALGVATGGTIVASSANAVVASSPTSFQAVSQGWYDTFGYHNSRNHNYFVGNDGRMIRDYFVFNLTGLTAGVSSASITFNNTCGGTRGAGSGGTYSLYDVATSISSLVSSAEGATNVYDDLGSGTSYGAASVTDVTKDVTVQLNSSGLAALNSAAGGALAVGGDYPDGGYLFGGSGACAGAVLNILGVGPLVVTPLVNVTGGSFQYGQGGTFTATVSQTVPAALGSIQFKVDGVNLGAPVALDNNGSATSPNLSTASGFPYAAGSHGVEADYIPADVTKWGAALGTAGFTITKAASTTQLALQGSSAVATVAAVAPGSGTPTGVVSFSRDGATIGTAQLSNGVATLTGLADGAANVAATYAGDSNFTGSSGSTARQMPTIVATATSPIAKTSYGWYRSPVSVSFTCTTNGSPLTGPCPAPVTLASSGAAQSVTETILAQDGGAATAVVNGINIDRGRPQLWVEGVVAGHHYASAPSISCVGADSLSGIASCTVAVGRASHGVVHYTATATDKAGNVKTVRGYYFLNR